MYAPAVQAPVIKSVVANRVSERLSEILIKWTDEDSSYVDRYVFFFGLQTYDQECISAGTQTEPRTDIDEVNGTFIATLQHSLDPFVKYTVQVAQDWNGDAFGTKSEAFQFSLNVTRKHMSQMHCVGCVLGL